MINAIDTGKERTLEDPLLPRDRDHVRTSPNSFDESHDCSFGERSRTGHSTIHSAETSRMLDRNGVFHQSRGHWAVRRACAGIRFRRCSRAHRKNMWEDWFYSLSYKNTLTLTFILLATYSFIIVSFAYIYLAVSKVGGTMTKAADGSITDSFCGMDINNHMEAMYFSLSTMTTIGYGVSDYYFGDCWTPLVLVLLQSICAISFQSVAIGLLFQRISRGQKRGRTVIFSDKAVIRRVKGVPYLMFRIGELRRHQLIDASAHAYCLRHMRYPSGRTMKIEGVEVPEIQTTHFITRPMQLLQKSHLLMSLPQVIVHRLDEKSPLLPPNLWYDETGYAHGSNNDGDRTNGRADSDEVYDFLRDRGAEIVVMIEGTDELTGHPLQAKHSYSAEDTAWDHTFASCIRPWNGEERQEGWFGSNCQRRRDDPVCMVDFAKFHNIEAAAPCDFDPYVPI